MGTHWYKVPLNKRIYKPLTGAQRKAAVVRLREWCLSLTPAQLEALRKRKAAWARARTLTLTPAQVKAKRTAGASWVREHRKTHARKPLTDAQRKADATRARERRKIHPQIHKPLTDAQRTVAAAWGRRRRAAEPEKRRAYLREWRKANPIAAAAINAKSKARREGVPGPHATKAELNKLCQQRGGQCAYCNEAATATDHWVPLSRWNKDLGHLLLGPPNSIHNLQRLCDYHNGSSGKWHQNPLEYEAKIGVRSRLALRYYKQHPTSI